MTDMDVVQVIAQVGFPIAVSSYLLTVGFQKLERINEVLIALKNEIEELRKEHMEMAHGAGNGRI